MKISNLTDYPDEIKTIANWYFNEWDCKDSGATLESVIEKVSSVSNRIAFVAHLDGELAGAGELQYREYSSYPKYNYWLDGIYIPIEQRGKGISKALIKFAKKKAGELRVPTIYLRCEEHLVKLYEAHGFQVVCTEKTKLIMEHKVNT
ncbi:GNAT family N-acetyltransferase [Vibrio sp. NH-UV-68]|uniref:GNAT family N-acetyltransferase n=1 Tax=unclassified Vibrio TaxID=2614977 RepID=UPI0036F31F96